MGDGVGVVVMSAGHVWVVYVVQVLCGVCGMRGVGGVREMCMCLARAV